MIPEDFYKNKSILVTDPEEEPQLKSPNIYYLKVRKL